jgi:dihydroorotate dehydrogenase (fumarate)
MNLETTYLGMPLTHPIVASSSPLTRDLDGIRRLEDAGASAIVLHSLFEEQLMEESRVLDHYLDYGSESYSESLSYVPDLTDYNSGPDGYLELVRKAKERVEIPIIGSLNGVTPGGWKDYANQIEEAGADALELNLYFIPSGTEVSGQEIEEQYLEVVREVRKHTRLPLAVKLCPYFSSLPDLARALTVVGADALVLFNRFYQPDFDLETLDVAPKVHLSDPNEFRLPLTWTAILYGRVKADLGITTGVHTHEEVIKGVMAGANVTMMASALLNDGLQTIQSTLATVGLWMEQHDYESIEQMRGSLSQRHAANPSAFVRPNYMKTLQSWSSDPSLGHGQIPLSL